MSHSKTRQGDVVTAVAITALLFACAGSAVRASISITGNVTPDPNSVNSSEPLYVGDTVEGTMSVDGGSSVASSAGYIAYASGSGGSADVSGTGSEWNTGTGRLSVGDGGLGYMTISHGGSVTSGQTIVGNLANSDGVALVADSGSSWSTGELILGELGDGSLNISNGGSVNATDATAGAQFRSTGSIQVDGEGSTLTAETLWLGNNSNTSGGGYGTLAISNGAQVIDSSGATV